MLQAIIKEYLLIFQKWFEKFIKKNPPAEWKNGNTGDILLVPGFDETWVFLETIGNYFNNKGYKIHTVSTIEPNVKPIKYCVGEVMKYIVKNNLTNVIIMSHSKGGIVTKRLLQNTSIEERVKIAFSLATPYGGVHWAYKWMKNVYEFVYTSEIINEMEKTRPSKKLINLYPRFDQVVFPKNKLFLHNGTNIEVDVVGHAMIMESNKTINEIWKCINK